MLVSFQDNITKISNLRKVELNKVLNDIRSGTYKNHIFKLREIGDKKKRNDYKKKNLPYFVPAIFKTGTRKIMDLEFTELIIFDIDEIQLTESGISLQSLIEQLTKDNTVFSLFTSPSGKGLKVLFKLNKQIIDSEHFNNLYIHFGNKFKSKYKVAIDPSCKDVSRACFLSYDPKLYLNENAVPISTDIKIKEIYNVNNKYYKEEEILSDNESKFKGIVNWIENKKGLVYANGYKYNYLVTLSGTCNRYGIDKEYLKQKLIAEYQKRPNTDTVNSRDFEDIVERIYLAYRNQHNTKNFICGNIEKSFSGLIMDLEFWYLEKEKLNLSREKFLQFLKLNGFGKMYYAKDYLFIRILDNIIYEVDENRLKDFVLNYSKNLKIPGIYELLLRGCNIYFGENFLSSIETIEPNIKRDTCSEAYFYFKNCFARVTQKGITVHDYSELDGLIWDKQRMDRDFRFTKDKSDFEKFIQNIGGGDIERICSLNSAIGYLLHSNKDSSNAKAIVFCDERIGDGSNGRCGKSVVGKAIGKLKNLVEEDGRNFSMKSNFAFQRVSLDTQVYFFNDVGKVFDFNRLFAMITDNMSVEKKNKQAFSIPFEESPKILLSTNFVIKDDDDSTADRKFEVEFSDHYNINHRPVDEFGRRFFNDWNEADWNSFDSYMLGCVQLYLSEGLVKTKYVNLDLKRIEAKTSKEFIEFMNDVELDKEYNKKAIFEKFKLTYPDYDNLRQNTFTKWMKSYTDFKELKYNQRKSGNEFFITVSNLIGDLEER